MIKEDNEDFKNSTKCWICDNNFIDSDVKVRYHYYITIKHRGFGNKNWSINVKLYHKISVVFYKLKEYDLHLIMQELGKLI